MKRLVDTSVLVYRFDSRFPAKQARAEKLLREGISSGELQVPHQAIVEMVAALTRRRRGEAALLETTEALREAEELLLTVDVVYPTEQVLRTALRGLAAYQLSWFDANIWAYAEVFGFPEVWSEDFQHGRIYGTVRIVDPFRDL